MYCKYCDAELPNNSEFCTICENPTKEEIHEKKEVQQKKVMTLSKTFQIMLETIKNIFQQSF